MIFHVTVSWPAVGVSVLCRGFPWFARNVKLDRAGSADLVPAISNRQTTASLLLAFFFFFFSFLLAAQRSSWPRTSARHFCRATIRLFLLPLNRPQWPSQS